MRRGGRREITYLTFTDRTSSSPRRRRGAEWLKRKRIFLCVLCVLFGENRAFSNFSGFPLDRLRTRFLCDLFRLLLQIPRRIHRPPVAHHLEVQVRPGGAARYLQQQSEK